MKDLDSYTLVFVAEFIRTSGINNSERIADIIMNMSKSKEK